MILFETACVPVVRPGEAVVAGRRLAGRLLPYGADAAAVPFRFDPVERRFVVRRGDATLHAGPHCAGPWAEALARLAPGPVLVGPCSPSEEVRGAYLAATEAALASGRPVYLLDPEPTGLPEAAGPSAVALCTWRPGAAASAFPALAPARAAGIECAALFPLLPGWTGEPEAIEELIEAAARAGAVAATAILPVSDGEGRRAIVEARESVEPSSADGFFEVIHHGDWMKDLSEGISAVRTACARRGLALLPPRPVGRREFPGNAAVAALLEERAELDEAGEHRAALLHAAVRWIDESGRDLAAVAREGNFPKVFPFGGEILAEAAASLAAAR
jgi:hypothetical protein